MNKLVQIINEEISAITKDKKEEIFDYHSITEDSWYDPKEKAQDFQKIHFDFENDISTGQKKRFFVKKNLRKDQPIKYEVQAELFEAGGDWENMVLYFRIEFTHQYGVISNKYCKNPEYVWDVGDEDGNLSVGRQFVLIPPNEAGNKLQKGGKEDKADWYAYSNNETSKEKQKELRITDADKRKAWDWLAKLLEKVINERHEMLDNDNRETKLTEPEDSAD